MPIDYRTIVWNQYGAALDMLEDAIRLCPDQLWTLALWEDSNDARYGQFWFLAYHAVFWSDLYFTGASEGFAPPPPFERGKWPDQPYPKDQVLAYLRVARAKCHAMFEGLTEERAQQICVFPWMELSFLELQIYAMRHVQEHAGQMSLALGQHGVTGFDWLSGARVAAV